MAVVWNWRYQVRRQVRHQVCYSVMLLLSMIQPSMAQIVEDNSLLQRSIVTPSGTTTIITGGTETGPHLFHSFREFSVPNRGTASFRNVSPQIETVFTRVTGTAVSRINGRIELLQPDGQVSAADLFLLNPNGILFGPQASLNLGGSFLATTADRIRFSDGSFFSAVNPTATPLLTMSAPIGLQFGPNPGRIVNRSVAPVLDAAGQPLVNFAGDPVAGLQVAPGQTLALLGGAVQLAGGRLVAASGQIALGSVAAGKVGLVPADPGWRFDYDPITSFGPIRLTQAAYIDGIGPRGGAIRLRGDRIVVTDESVILAETLADQRGQGISLQARQITLTQFAYLSSVTYGPGRSGDIRLTADRLTVTGGAQVEVGTDAAGRGGNLVARASESIEITDIARDRRGRAILVNGFPFRSALLALVNNDLAGEDAAATGQSGNLIVVTPRLHLSAGGQLVAETLGPGDAGTITIRATDIELTGVALDGDQPLLFRGVPISPSAISAFTQTEGRAGTIRIEADRLSVRDGAVVQSTTQGSGAGGNLTIRARESVEVVGTARGLTIPSGLLTFSGGVPGTERDFGFSGATGRAGNLTLQTAALTVGAGGLIAVGSLNPNLAEAQPAGQARIDANIANFEDQGALLANTAAGQGGNVRLTVGNLLFLRRNSAISTTAGSANQGGDGGNIQVRSPFILAISSENSDITANAFTGDGGRINITAQGILGISPRDRQTPQSDITASSEFGTSGLIRINTVDVDPTQGLIELPGNLIDPTQQIAQACPTGNQTAESGEFVITGRGGVPLAPTDARTNPAIVTNWASLEPSPARPANQQADPLSEQLADQILDQPLDQPLDQILDQPLDRSSESSGNTSVNSSANQSVPSAPQTASATPTVSSIVEAQGWVVGADRKIRLVAPVSHPLPYRLSSPSC